MIVDPRSTSGVRAPWRGRIVVALVGLLAAGCRAPAPVPGTEPEVPPAAVVRPAAPKGGSVVGGGRDGAGEYFGISAFQGPDGVHGNAWIAFAYARIRGHVTCYAAVSPHTSRFGLAIDERGGKVPRDARGFAFYVEDNGGPGAPVPDVIGTGFTRTPPTDCGKLRQSGSTPVVAGDIVVRNPK